jgi:hypothetical protein
VLSFFADLFLSFFYLVLRLHRGKAGAVSSNHSALTPFKEKHPSTTTPFAGIPAAA